MKVFTAANEEWTTYRLPKASHCFDHKWQNEWPRIRETEHERLLMDHHGLFYELSPWAYGNRVWGVRPISTHLWVLVMGADNASPSSGASPTTGEPQSGIWMGKTDDLWQFGKPAGWGGPWWEAPVTADTPSDPYLMTGFDKKCLHIRHGAFERYTTVETDRYAVHVFPEGLSAHWLRLVPEEACTVTAQLHYT